MTDLYNLVNAYPAFLNVFGVKAPDGSLQIPPRWQNGLTGAINCGEILGLQVGLRRRLWYSVVS